MTSAECQEKSASQSLPRTGHYISGREQRQGRPTGSESGNTNGV